MEWHDQAAPFWPTSWIARDGWGTGWSLFDAATVGDPLADSTPPSYSGPHMADRRRRPAVLKGPAPGEAAGRTPPTVILAWDGDGGGADSCGPSLDPAREDFPPGIGLGAPAPGVVPATGHAPPGDRPGEPADAPAAQEGDFRRRGDGRWTPPPQHAGDEWRSGTARDVDIIPTQRSRPVATGRPPISPLASGPGPGGAVGGRHLGGGDHFFFSPFFPPSLFF